MPRRIRDVEAAGQNRHSETVGGQRRAVGGAVDAVGAAGDHRDIALSQPGGQIGRNLFAVYGCRPGPDDGGGSLRHLVKTDRTQCPQHHRRPAARPRLRPGTREGGERERRPLVVVGGDQSPATTGEKLEIISGPVDFAP